MKRLTFHQSCLLAIFCSLLFFLNSCQKESLTQESSLRDKNLTYKDIEVGLVEGRLVLNSVDDVIFLRYDEMNHPKDLIQWTKNIPGFESAMTAFDKINPSTVREDLAGIKDIAYLNEIDGEKVLDPVIDDPIFRYLANSNGIFQLGSKVYKLFRDTLASTALETFDSYGVNAFRQNHLVNNQAIQRKTIHTGVIQSRAQVDDCNDTYDNGDMKVIGKLEENNDFWTNYVSCRVESRNKRKSGWTWSDNNAEQLSVDGAFRCRDDLGDQGLFGAEASDEEVSYIGKTFYVGPNATVTDGDCIHTAVDNGGLVGSCMTFDD